MHREIAIRPNVPKAGTAELEAFSSSMWKHVLAAAAGHVELPLLP